MLAKNPMYGPPKLSRVAEALPLSDDNVRAERPGGLQEGQGQGFGHGHDQKGIVGMGDLGGLLDIFQTTEKVGLLDHDGARPLCPSLLRERQGP